MEELKTYRLADICNSIQTGPFGSQLHKSDYVEFGTPIVMPKDITNGKINDNNISRISKNDVAKLFKHKLVSGNIIYPRRGDISKCALITSKEDGWVCGTGCIKVDINQQIANSTYVMYVLCQSETVNWIESNAVGTTMLNLNTSILSDLPIKLPSLNTQKKLANIVSSFDKKIDLNRRINDNLEQQAQTLFKSWLVDFDPFKNGKFVESEMGMIPEGWKVISLQEYCQEITRGNIPTYVEKSNRPILNQKVNKGVSLEKQYYKYNSENVEVSISKMAHYGDVLLNSLGQGTLGRVHLYKEKLGNVIIDQFITILRTNLFVKSAYLSYTLNRPEYQTIIEGNVTGSTGMWVLTINNVRNIKIIVPKESCFLELAPIINSIYQAISNNTAEMEQLCTLRDCILPHLMSGELKINDLNC
ncbi:restriction endonuclease subunit S [Bacteroides ovatus]|uniref:Restriction endonuclease subunit S n=2 Tax=Bacteroidaceae TaxID=815 RepID=A0A9P4DX49_BACOV|nr:restriction endonuclease subunit S [Bacteroides ovatus]KAA3930398.1 restriction endonuclease subunit S [Bacteroides ovatus]MDB1047633.1 restriction endonuclease subunit S [Phocaeicola vulgatus]